MDDPSLPKSLADIEAWIDDALARGAKDANSAFHWPTLGTTAEDGGPALRTVVLRAYDRQRRMLTTYTDGRAMKIDQLKAESRAAFHVYDAKKRVQLRLNGRVLIHREGDLWEAAWERVQNGSTTDYAHRPAPGTQINGHDAYEEEGAKPEAHFTVLNFEVESADYLHLGREGQRRAKLTYTGRVTAEWVAP